MPTQNQRTVLVPICASNESYLEELRRVVQSRFTLADQEGALREVMMRNKEEYLLKKKNMNVVDEMQLGLINLEKSYAAIKELTQTLLNKTIEKQMVTLGKKPVKNTTAATTEYRCLNGDDIDMEFDDLDFKK
jgi:hypothetical protein